MENLRNLENRIQTLEDIENIKKLKARYFNTIDRKLWLELADCFSEDGVWESQRLPVKVEGAEAIVKFIKGREDGDHIINTHQGHNIEIEIINKTTARSICQSYHYREDIKENIRRQNAVFYEDNYIKEKGCWKIKYTRILPIYLNESKTGD
ncbi:MAG: nuclear transport factor 2 family protein [Syntrophomonadaceae bacterium]|nr:nuclear transport factor 2 family protein [Syntrophomonadaceae bacterium]